MFVTMCRVEIRPFKKTVEVETDTTLLEAAEKAGIIVNGLCGKGLCGRCRAIVLEGACEGGKTSPLTDEEIAAGYVLACHCRVKGDIIIDIPAETGASEKVVLDKQAGRFMAVDSSGIIHEYGRDPLVRRVKVELPVPDLDDNLADLQRLRRALAKAGVEGNISATLEVTRKLPGLLRDNNFSVTATLARLAGGQQIVDVLGPDAGPGCLAVVDIGTTTVVMHILNADDMSLVAPGACFNSQAVYGREVTARIMASEDRGVEVMQKHIVVLSRIVMTI